MTDENEIRSYRDLRVWNEAMELAADCYRMTTSFPRDEMFGMTAQIRRAGASIPANIAEGYGRDSTGNYVQFLKTAQGSLKELETHVLLAAKVGLVPQERSAPLLERAETVGKMLRGLMRSIRPTGGQA
ncbi:four helix bundle protein [Mesorhizobium sp. YIM 152430]|uniref:four helix bundle protein n=1 Tax=Mesorhizobium sp. YIM 152430 TaxID=3031761 RepID=UPI0023DA2C22|nr:four helix bundle protein [Mesorhizobium sp. YIM 152430]MDF1599866.1 four helix bundle protein [Mesorhizobium sp. YIM 152430]